VRVCVRVLQAGRYFTELDGLKALLLFLSKVFFFFFTYKVFGLLHASL